MNKNLATKIFLDSGNPQETQDILSQMGFLDGQTTNPSLVTQNPVLQDKLANGTKLEKEALLEEYKKIILEIKRVIPDGAISIEVYADLQTTSEEMIAQARELNQWIDKPYIKLPTNSAGLEAASVLHKENVLLNMTLCFSQQQAAAVYSATSGAQTGSVFVSPFIGRLDDIGLQGMDLIRNIRDMYSQGDHHVELLAASVRSIKHFLYALYLESDIITAPYTVLKQWVELNKPIPGTDIALEEFVDVAKYLENNYTPIEPEEIDLNLDFHEYNIAHELTTKGIEKFAQDWNSLLKTTTF